MNHESCRERLVDLAYGELSRREAVEVERHLAECEPCRRERDRLADTLGAMRRLEAPPPPERSDAIVLAAARRAVEERRRDSFGRALRSFSLRVAAGTAFAALAVFLVVQVRQGVRPPTEDAAREGGRAPGEPAQIAEPRLAPADAPHAEPPAVAAAPEKREAAPAPSRPRRSFAVPPPEPGARAEVESPPREEGKARSAEKKAAGAGAEPTEQREPKWAAAPPPSAPAPAAKASPSPSETAAEGEANAIASPQAPVAAPAQPAPSAPNGSSAVADARRSRATAPGAREADVRAGVASPELYRSRQLHAASGPVTPWAREVERRRASGDLAEAQKRFEPCPGGDVRRIAWIDGAQRVLKLVRERADGAVVEEWFDESARLREALVRARAGGGSWTRHVTLGEHGEENSQDASDTGLAPEAPPPPLVRRDPSAAFFSGAGCAAPAKP